MTETEAEESDIWQDDAFMGKMKKSIAKDLRPPVITKGPPIKEPPRALTRPENRGAVENKSSVKPYELDAELAQLKMADLMIQRLPTPSKVNKAFIARMAIWQALNNTEDNPTGYDCSMRIKLYEKYALQTVNEDGMYFERFWAFMMKPKYIINGMQQGQPEEKESLIGRAVGWLRGKPKEPAQPGGM